MKKITEALLVTVFTLALPLRYGNQNAEAATKYITVSEYAKALALELDLKAQADTEDSVHTLIKAGIIKDGDFKDYSAYLTRGDMLVLLNRADEYLNQSQVDAKLIKTILEKRISDIKKAAAAKREDIAKGYAKGFLKGYSNGYYIQNRNLKLTSKVTKSGALNCLKMLKNPSLRAKISPDGQLIRTTNLPKNADKFEYILETYPNAFYERLFEFMLFDKYKNPDYRYGYPVDMRNMTFRNWYAEWPLSEEMDKYLYDWAELAEKYLNYIFNVDYRTVDDEWIEGLGALYTKSNLNEADDIRKYYIGPMKKNRVVVESSIIAVEPSVFYMDGYYCMRAYVKYRIKAENINTDQFQLLYSQYPALDNLKSGVWREGVFDIRFGTNNGSSGDGSDFAIDPMTHFVDAYNIRIK
jgi:hypothetical protein